MSASTLPQAIEVERLGQVLARAELDRFDGAVDAGVAGHENHFAAGHGAAGSARSRSSPFTSGIRRSTIARSAGLRVSSRIASAPFEQVIDVESGLGGEALDQLAARAFVVDDEQRGRGAAEAGEAGEAECRDMAADRG